MDRPADRERRRSALARIQRGDRPAGARRRTARRTSLDLRTRLRTACAIAAALSGYGRGRERGVGPRRSGPFRAAHPERGTGREVLLCLLTTQRAQLRRPKAVTRAVRLLKLGPMPGP